MIIIVVGYIPKEKGLNCQMKLLCEWISGECEGF